MSEQGRNIIASAIPQSRLVEIETQDDPLSLSSEPLQQNISLKVIKPFVSYNVHRILDRNKGIRNIVRQCALMLIAFILIPLQQKREEMEMP